MNRHVNPLTSKSKTHTVKQTGPQSFTVVSGSTGNEYFITLLAHGGANCTCDFATKRHVTNCACSHTIAVFAYIEAEKGRTIKAHTDFEQAQKQHRPTINMMDGITLTSRKAG